MAKHPAVENSVIAALEATGARAVTEDELKRLSGVHGTSFKESLIRLTRKGIVVKWKNEHCVNHIALAKYANTAYYAETAPVDPLAVMFGLRGSVTVHRSAPFSILHDEEEPPQKIRSYAAQVA